MRVSTTAVGLLLMVLAFATGANAHPTHANNAQVRDPLGVAVIVGNRNYEHERIPDVDYAHRDADAFRAWVVGVLGYDPDRIIDLRDADKAALERAFGNERTHEGLLWRRVDPGSDVMVFWSGHGVPGLRDRRGYLLPVNADPNTAEIDGYSLDTLYANLAQLEEARSVRVFLDACFSGDSDRGALVEGFSGAPTIAPLPRDPRAHMTVLTAATGAQVASWDEEAEHGLFTHHLLDALYGRGDVNGDRRVTVAEAKAHLDRHMTRAARRSLGRVQDADLRGAGSAVLSVAPPAGFPLHPPLTPPILPQFTEWKTINGEEYQILQNVQEPSLQHHGMVREGSGNLSFMKVEFTSHNDLILLIYSGGWNGTYSIFSTVRAVVFNTKRKEFYGDHRYQWEYYHPTIYDEWGRGEEYKTTESPTTIFDFTRYTEYGTYDVTVSNEDDVPETVSFTVDTTRPPFPSFKLGRLRNSREGGE